MFLSPNGGPMKRKVCVFGKSGDLYTAIVTKHLDDLRIPYDLLLESSAVKKRTVPKYVKICEFFIKLHKSLNTGEFMSLSFWSPYKYSRFLRSQIYRRSSFYKNLVSGYVNYTPQAMSTVKVPNINHVRSYKHLVAEEYSLGILAGVGIVDASILETFKDFCISAHPAPLPECRGGGAIENTLFYGLQPAVTVHIVTQGIDEGDILHLSPLSISKQDSIFSLATRLMILAGEELAKQAQNHIEGVLPQRLSNQGKLHFWKDLNAHIQKTAEKNLKEMTRSQS